jgi:hypothetical protein
VLGEMQTDGNAALGPTALMVAMRDRTHQLAAQEEQLQGLIKIKHEVCRVIDASYPVDSQGGGSGVADVSMDIPLPMVEAHLRGLVQSYRVLQARARTWVRCALFERDLHCPYARTDPTPAIGLKPSICVCDVILRCSDRVYGWCCYWLEAKHMRV